MRRDIFMPSLCLSSFEVLLVEDNPSDAMLIAKAFEQISQPYNLRIVRDGDAAMLSLLQPIGMRDYPLPDLILLDLHLPKKDGLTVLREIKSNPSLAVIPVIMLTASDLRHDIAKCYKEEANSYLVKPRNLTEFNRTIESLQNFWLQIAKLPFRV